MKNRMGFVSNSSSSSFMLAVKGELTEERVFDALGVAEDSPLAGFARDVAKAIVNCIDDRYTHKIPDTLLASMGSYYRNNVDAFKEDYGAWIDLLGQGYVLMGGSFDEFDREAVEAWLCYNGISISEPGLIVEAEGGY